MVRYTLVVLLVLSLGIGSRQSQLLSQSKEKPKSKIKYAAEATNVIVNTPLGEVFPERFTIPEVIDSPWLPPGIGGGYGLETGAIHVRTDFIKTHRFGSFILAHEVGHSIWYRDLSEGERSIWIAVHGHYVGKRKGIFGPSLPREIEWYYDYPAHSFADAVGAYVTAGKDLRERSELIYTVMKGIFMGREYR